MTKENDMGPLWEGEPKISGFRLSVPDPQYIRDWIHSTCDSLADSTQKQNTIKAYQEIKMMFEGASRLMGSNEKSWEVQINDGTLEEIKVEIVAGYNPKDGNWAHMVAFVEFSDVIKRFGLHYGFVANASNVSKSLEAKGIPNQHTKEGIEQLLIMKESAGQKVEIFLGLANPADAKAWAVDSDDEEVNDWSPMITIDELDLSVEGFSQDLGYFQKVLSHFVDSVYAWDNKTSPNLILELSKENELE